MKSNFNIQKIGRHPNFFLCQFGEGVNIYLCDSEVDEVCQTHHKDEHESHQIL